jgi:hypothetical protein
MFEDWIQTTYKSTGRQVSGNTSLFDMESYLMSREGHCEYKQIMKSFVDMRNYHRANPVMTVRGKQKIGKGAILRTVWPEAFASSAKDHTKDAVIHNVPYDGGNLRVIDLPARDDASIVVSSMVDAVVRTAAIVLHVVDLDQSTTQSFDDQIAYHSIAGNDYVLINGCDKSHNAFKEDKDKKPGNWLSSIENDTEATWAFEKKCANAELHMSSCFVERQRIFFVAAAPGSSMPKVSELDMFVPNVQETLPPIPMLKDWPKDYEIPPGEVLYSRGVALLLKRLHDLTFPGRKLPLIDSDASNYYANDKLFRSLNLMEKKKLVAETGGGGGAAAAPQPRPALHDMTADGVATAVGRIGPPYRAYEHIFVDNGIDGITVARLTNIPKEEGGYTQEQALKFLQSLGVSSSHSYRVFMMFQDLSQQSNR